MLFLKNKRLSVLYAVFIIVYLLQTVLTPADKATLTKYHLHTAQYKVLVLTIALPYIVIWLIALVGYLRLKTYATIIKRDKDGAAFNTIAKGILWVSIWQPLSTIIANYFTHYYGLHHTWTGNLTRIDNYITLVILFVGFWLINKGSNQLLSFVKRPSFTISQSLALIYITFAALYVTLTLQDPAREFPTKSVTVASYYEPDWVLVFTLVIPRLIYWFLGVQAVRSIILYRNKVKGTLYKHALNRLALGLAVVVATTIVLRCLQSLSSPLAHLSLALLLGVIYLLLILISVGYILIAKGANNLQQLEEL